MSTTPTLKISDMKPGDLFRAIYRVCTIEVYEPTGELLVKSVVDGWSGRLAQFGEGECEPIPMPSTPLELLRFIQEFQIKYDDRLQQ